MINSQKCDCKLFIVFAWDVYIRRKPHPLMLNAEVGQSCFHHAVSEDSSSLQRYSALIQ